MDRIRNKWKNYADKKDKECDKNPSCLNDMQKQKNIAK